MILFKTLMRRYHDLMKCVAQRPEPVDAESAKPLLEALEQLAAEAERLEARLRVLSENRQRLQPPEPHLRLVWPPRDDKDKANG
ncbi:hypothetical protein [Pseudomonas sp. Marseille-P9899]|uniref:hypothetical protein n=1 Tax=Pseudomonas sp. Marseille-P9899 TaxID=2730401 RepID=UPI00158E09E7|nr:hypothetical protein [Pseudomonas sp. Marseille-P9899]